MSPAPSTGIRTTFIGIALWLLAFLTYLPDLWNDFVGWDDPIYVTHNRAVAAGLTSQSIWYALTTFDSFNWIPVTWLSYELDATVFGLNPAAFHAVNNFWHACNVCLLFYVLLRLTGAMYRSAAVAALFAVHPLHGESVAWVSARKDLLSTCALLLAILAWHRYVTRPSRWRYLLVFALMAFGLLAKSMVVTLPILLLLLDIWPLKRWGSRSGASTNEVATIPKDGTPTPLSLWILLLEKAPLFLLAIADGLITMSAQRAAMTAAAALPLPMRLGNAMCAYAWYLWKTIWPTGLCAFYQHPLQSLSIPLAIACALLMGGLTFAVLLRARREPYLLVGWLWFVISLLPVIGIVQVGTQAYADRYSYLPHIGLLMAIVWGTHQLLQSLPASQWIGTGLVVGATALGIVLTTSQITVWRNDRTLWTHTLELDPYNAIAHLQLGQVDAQNRAWDAAQDHYSDVMVHRPSDPQAILMLGYIHQQNLEWELAAEYYLWMLRLSPNDPVATHNLASLPSRPPASPPRSAVATEKRSQALRHARRGEVQAALKLVQEAAKLDPQDVQLQNNVATALEELNRPAEAREHYQQALRINPQDVEAKHGVDRIDKRGQ